MIDAMPDYQILLSFVGNRDPFPVNETEDGPLLALLVERGFDAIYLVLSSPDYLERARTLEAILGQRGVRTSISLISLELDSVVDYEEIFSKLHSALLQVVERNVFRRPRYHILLDPGTPQMQTCWFLLARSNLFPATLLQGIPPKFNHGKYRVREIDFKASVLPVMVSPERDTCVAEDHATYGDEKTSRGSCSGDQPAGLPVIVAEAPAMREVLETARQVAKYDVTVLIRGETGTGKSLLARYVHDHSGRSKQPFLPVNCGAIPRELAESELFGHGAGAFTGAERERLGYFRAADGGTIFLDEVAELSAEIQAKLLRVIESGRFIPMGKDAETATSVRLLAATHQDLRELVRTGKFRRDLFERLNQAELTLPPLRERDGEIDRLVEEFLSRWNGKYGEARRLDADLLEAVRNYSWPGNIRELENAIFRACSTCPTESVGARYLPPEVTRPPSAATPAALPTLDFDPDRGVDLATLKLVFEKRYVDAALACTGGNKERAASLLGMDGAALRKALRERLA